MMGIVLYLISGGFERVAMPWKTDVETVGL
jgi:hypothetical protein